MATSSKAERVEAAQGIGDEARETAVCEYRKPLFHLTYPAETERVIFFDFLFGFKVGVIAALFPWVGS